MRRRKHNQGQTALEYALATTVVVGITSLIWLFYQGFVVGSFYGGDPQRSGSLGFSGKDKSLGLEKVVALPVP